MKKFFAALLTFAMAISCFTVSVSAKTGDKVGVALNTDIVAYVNHYAVASYAVNGQSCIVAEDLNNFGFDVVWNGYARTLTISRNYAKNFVNEMTVTKYEATGAYFCDILETDIVVYAGGKRITSYAMNGYTMIPVEELTMFGTVAWDNASRTLKLWVEDGLAIRNTRQMPLTKAPVVSRPATSSTYSGTTIPTYTSITGVPATDVIDLDGGTGYIYDYTSEDAVLSYMEVLAARGWELYDIEEDYTTYSVTSYLVKYSTGEAFVVSVEFSYDEVWIVVQN